MKVNFNKRTKFNEKISYYFNNALKVLNISENVFCDVFFVSKKKIKKVNNRFRNINKVTDVLSFPSALKPNEVNMQTLDWNEAKLTSFDPENNAIFLGDIMISISVAKRQAKEYGHSVYREACYLAVHGLLHLLGYDHILDDDKAIMRKIEEEILEK